MKTVFPATPQAATRGPERPGIVPSQTWILEKQLPEKNLKMVFRCLNSGQKTL